MQLSGYSANYTRDIVCPEAVSGKKPKCMCVSNRESRSVVKAAQVTPRTRSSWFPGAGGIVVIEREPNADSADCGQGAVLHVVRTEYTARSGGNCSLISLPLVTLATVGLVPRGLLSLAQVAARLRRG